MNHQTYVVLGISGSLRKDSSNTRLLSFIKRMMPAGTEFRMYQGLATLPHFSPDLDGDEAEPHEAVREWREELRAADAIVNLYARICARCARFSQERIGLGCIFR